MHSDLHICIYVNQFKNRTFKRLQGTVFFVYITIIIVKNITIMNPKQCVT